MYPVTLQTLAAFVLWLVFCLAVAGSLRLSPGLCSGQDATFSAWHLSVFDARRKHLSLFFSVSGGRAGPQRPGSGDWLAPLGPPIFLLRHSRLQGPKTPVFSLEGPAVFALLRGSCWNRHSDSGSLLQRRVFRFVSTPSGLLAHTDRCDVAQSVLPAAVSSPGKGPVCWSHDCNL